MTLECRRAEKQKIVNKFKVAEQHLEEYKVI
jgi:hypothetical protein